MNKSQLRGLRTLLSFIEVLLQECIQQGVNKEEKVLESHLKKNPRQDETDSTLEVIEYWGFWVAE